MKIKVKDIIYRQDLYPRFEPNQSIIQKYSDSIEHLPAIKLDQHNILIDGFHRWKAFQLAGIEEIPYEIIEVESEKELKKLAYQLNSNHGLQLSNDEKKKYAQEMFGEMSNKEMSVLLGVSEKSIQRWTESQAESAKEERDRKIVEFYLKAWNTQEAIAEIMNVGIATVNDVIKKFEKRQMSIFEETFKPLLYNVWKLQKQDNERKHFGAFPEVFMENLLHYHTEPLDIIFDPFGGGGTTVDVCKRMFRRYYVSDRKVIPGRENDIKEYDIMEGLPSDLQKPDLVFLDPPYWVLAKDEYSEDKETDLGNMTKDEFFASMNQIAIFIKTAKIKRIAYVIRPIWQTGKEGWQWVDPMFEFYDSISDKYSIETRYVMPYSTEQYSAFWVDRAKKQNKQLILNRELTIFKLK
jgi:DNA modification methylase